MIEIVSSLCVYLKGSQSLRYCHITNLEKKKEFDSCCNLISQRVKRVPCNAMTSSRMERDGARMKRNILLDFLTVLSRFFSPFTEFITYSFWRRASACSLCVHNAPLRLSTLLERTSGFVSRFSLHSGVITIIHTDVHGHARFHVFPQSRCAQALIPLISRRPPFC